MPVEYWRTDFSILYCSVDGLSILIPVYCDNCLNQVKSLVGQCRRLSESGLKWEIIVADDGSPVGENTVNSPIGRIEHCSFIMRNHNYGRSSTRNFLVRLAHYDTILFQDSGLLPSESLVETYIKYANKAQVVCGSVEVAPQSMNKSLLRALYEDYCSKRFTPETRNRNPYMSFRSCNFMASRKVLLDNPFSEEMKKYGYEDVILGKQLKESGVGVFHINNPVRYINIESNGHYLRKVNESIDTLYEYRAEIRGYSRLLSLVEKIEKLHLSTVVSLADRFFCSFIERKLSGKTPNLFLFNIYRVFLLQRKYTSR